ncbi:MAG: phage tail family protein [Chloroflexi bacterium]|nr:phage tail family protein [Chloroflexota bacterium]
MDSVVSFGAYNFDQENQIAFDYNFSQLRSALTPIYAVEGAFDEYGYGRAPYSAGSIRLQFWLHANRFDMDAARTSVLGMTEYDKARLTIQPNGVMTAVNRFCNARVSNVAMPQTSTGRNSIRQRVNMEFEVNDPFWIVNRGSLFRWGGSQWSAARWGSAENSFAISGRQTDINVNVEGNMSTPPLFIFTTSSSQRIRSPLIIERLVNNVVVQSLRYNSNVNANGEFLIDCIGLVVRLNNVSAYGSAFVTNSRQWFELIPGVNNIRIRFGNAGDRASLRVIYQERYR